MFCGPCAEARGAGVDVARRRAEALLDRVALATVGRGRSDGQLLREGNEGIVIREPLVGGVALEEAGGAVPSAHHKPRLHLQRKAETRHDLLPVGRVAGALRTEDRTCRRTHRNGPRILDHAAVEQHVGGAIVRLIPGLIDLVTHAKVQRQVRQHLPVILKEARHAPLPLPGLAAILDLRRGDIVRDEVGEAVTGGALCRIRGEETRIHEAAERAEVCRVQKCLLITQRLRSDAEQVLAMLDGQVIAIRKGVVDVDLRSRRCAEASAVAVVRQVADVLVRKAGVLPARRRECRRSGFRSGQRLRSGPWEHPGPSGCG